MKKALVSATLMTLSLFAADRTAYVGTYTRPNASKGIYMFRLNDATGQMSDPVLAAETENPSFLTISKGGKFVYAVNEVNNGTVSAFAVEPDGKLRFLNKASSKGSGPCHLNIDSTGKFLAVANYSSGSTAILPLSADGKLGEAVSSVQHTGKSVNPKRQEGPHAHSVNFSADNKFLFVADLGLDEVKIYSFNSKSGAIKETAKLESPKAGGPRHLALGKNGLVYVLNEMGSSVSTFRWNGETKGQLLSTVSAIPADFKENTSGAEILLHPQGTLLFSSNRGHNSISLYQTDPATGSVKLLGQQPIGGKVPRGFVLSPDANFLIAGAQDSDKVFSFRIEVPQGKLTPVGSPINIGSPICIRFVK